MSVSPPDGWSSWEEHDSEYFREYQQNLFLTVSGIHNFTKGMPERGVSFCTCCGVIPGHGNTNSNKLSYIGATITDPNSIAKNFNEGVEQLIVRDKDCDIHIIWRDQ